MGERIVMAMYAALRATLVYGEAPELSTRALEFPRLRRRVAVRSLRVPQGPVDLR